LLAAHIAYGGVDGLFRRLDQVSPGDRVAVRAASGVVARYRIDDVSVYRKEALPAKVWARTGPERLALVTCGGTFDPARRRYDSNVVAWASRVGKED
jgi:LPXTG-site transpeptidase (sortase) family protein